MSRIIDLKKTVYEIHKYNPEIIEIMKELGFDSITAPGMGNTASPKPPLCILKKL